MELSRKNEKAKEDTLESLLTIANKQDDINKKIMNLLNEQDEEISSKNIQFQTKLDNQKEANKKLFSMLNSKIKELEQKFERYKEEISTSAESVNISVEEQSKNQNNLLEEKIKKTEGRLRKNFQNFEALIEKILKNKLQDFEELIEKNNQKIEETSNKNFKIKLSDFEDKTIKIITENNAMWKREIEKIEKIEASIIEKQNIQEKTIKINQDRIQNLESKVDNIEKKLNKIEEKIIQGFSEVNERMNRFEFWFQRLERIILSTDKLTEVNEEPEAVN